MAGHETPSVDVHWFSTIVCPECGRASREAMPNCACVIHFTCAGCRAVLTPKPGDCCVFCSYGDQPCPPRQERQ